MPFGIWQDPKKIFGKGVFFFFFFLISVQKLPCSSVKFGSDKNLITLLPKKCFLTIVSPFNNVASITTVIGRARCPYQQRRRYANSFTFKNIHELLDVRKLSNKKNCKNLMLKTKTYSVHRGEKNGKN